MDFQLTPAPVRSQIFQICLVSRFHHRIPFSLTVPAVPKTIDTMAPAEIDRKLQHSYEQSLAGEGRPFNEMLDELERSLTRSSFQRTQKLTFGDLRNYIADVLLVPDTPDELRGRMRFGPGNMPTIMPGSSHAAKLLAKFVVTGTPSYLTKYLALSKHAGALLLLIIVGTPLLHGLSTFLSGLD